MRRYKRYLDIGISSSPTLLPSLLPSDIMSTIIDPTPTKKFTFCPVAGQVPSVATNPFQLDYDIFGYDGILHRNRRLWEVRHQDTTTTLSRVRREGSLSFIADIKWCTDRTRYGSREWQKSKWSGVQREMHLLEWLEFVGSGHR